MPRLKATGGFTAPCNKLGPRVLWRCEWVTGGALLAGDCLREVVAAVVFGCPFDQAEFASEDEFDALECVRGLTVLLISVWDRILCSVPRVRVWHKGSLQPQLRHVLLLALSASFLKFYFGCPLPRRIVCHPPCLLGVFWVSFGCLLGM
jgi:hypothetical protein